MWHQLAGHAHLLWVLADDTETTTAPGDKGSGPSSTTLVQIFGGFAVAVIVAYLGYLGNRARNRIERQDDDQHSREAGATDYRLGQLEGHREDEQEARKVLDDRVDTHEQRLDDHDTRITALEARRRPRKPHDPDA